MAWKFWRTWVRLGRRVRASEEKIDFWVQTRIWNGSDITILQSELFDGAFALCCFKSRLITVGNLSKYPLFLFPASSPPTFLWRTQIDTVLTRSMSCLIFHTKEGYSQLQHPRINFIVFKEIITPKSMARGIKETYWPRKLSFHTVYLHASLTPNKIPPPFLVSADGAHNPTSAKTLGDYITHLIDRRILSILKRARIIKHDETNA